MLSAEEAIPSNRVLGKNEIKKMSYNPRQSPSSESKVSTPNLKESPSAVKNLSVTPLKESLSAIKKKISYRKKLVRNYAKKKVITGKMKNADNTLSIRNRLLPIILNEELEAETIASRVNQILRQELRKRLQWYISTNRQYANKLEGFDSTEHENSTIGSLHVSKVLKKARQRLKEKNREAAESWLVDQLYKKDYAVSKITRITGSVFHVAAALCNMALIQKILEPFRYQRRKLCNLKDEKGQTPLFYLWDHGSCSEQLQQYLRKKLIKITRSQLLLNRLSITIELTRFGATFAAFDYKNKNLFHRLVDQQRRHEIEAVFQSLTTLFVTGGKDSLRNRSVTVSKLVYQKFQKKLNKRKFIWKEFPYICIGKLIAKTFRRGKNMAIVAYYLPAKRKGSEEIVLNRYEKQIPASEVVQLDSKKVPQVVKDQLKDEPCDSGALMDTYTRIFAGQSRIYYVDASNFKYSMSFSLVPVKIEFIQELQYKNDENHKVTNVFFDSSTDEMCEDTTDLSTASLSKEDTDLLHKVTQRLSISQKHEHKDFHPKTGLKMWDRYKDKKKRQNLEGVSASTNQMTLKTCVRKIIVMCNLYACNKDRILDSLEKEIDAKKCYEAIFTYFKSMKSIEFSSPKRPQKQNTLNTVESSASKVDLSSDFHLNTLRPPKSNLASQHNGMEFPLNQSRKDVKKEYIVSYAKNFWYLEDTEIEEVKNFASANKVPLWRLLDLYGLLKRFHGHATLGFLREFSLFQIKSDFEKTCSLWAEMLVSPQNSKIGMGEPNEPQGTSIHEILQNNLIWSIKTDFVYHDSHTEAMEESFKNYTDFDREQKKQGGIESKKGKPKVPIYQKRGSHIFVKRKKRLYSILEQMLGRVEFEKRKKEVAKQIVETRIRISAIEALNRFSHHVINMYARGPHLLGNERDLFIALFVPGVSDEKKPMCLYKNDLKSCIDDFQKYDMSFYKTFLTEDAALHFLKYGTTKFLKTKLLEQEIKTTGNGIWKTAQIFDRHHFKFESTNPDFVVVKAHSEIEVAGNSLENVVIQCRNIWNACQASSSFFLRKMVKPALDASCGSEVCACIGHDAGDILEILEYSNDVKGSHATDDVALVFVHLLFAAVNHSNTSQAEKLLKILLKKGTNTLAKLNGVFALDIAAERGAYELCRLLIHNGACLKPRALICLLSDMESHEYYRKKTQERMILAEKNSTDQNHPGTPTSLTPRNNHTKDANKVEKIKKELDDFLIEIYAQNRERESMYISKKAMIESSFKSLSFRLGREIIFFGAANSTLIADTLERLLEKVGNKTFMKLIHDSDDYGVGPLHYASMNGHKDMIQLLVKLGADPNLRTAMPTNDNSRVHDELGVKICRSIVARHPNFKGYTPLALAVQNRHTECVKVLIELGADPFGRKASELNKIPNISWKDPACPYWLSLGLELRLPKKENYGLIEVGQKVQVSFKPRTKYSCQTSTYKDGIIESINLDSTCNVWFPENDQDTDKTTNYKHWVINKQEKSVSRILRSRIKAMAYHDFHELTGKGEMVTFRNYDSLSGEESFFFGEIKAVDYHDFSYLVLPLWKVRSRDDGTGIRWASVPRMKQKNLLHINEENIVTYAGRWRLNKSVNATCQTVYWKPGIQSHKSMGNDNKATSMFNNVAAVLHGRYHKRKNSVKLILSITSKIRRLREKYKRGDKSFHKVVANDKHSDKSDDRPTSLEMKNPMMLANRKSKKEKKVKKRQGEQYYLSKTTDGGTSNASRWLRKESEKMVRIHNLMKQTTAVKNMRDIYARNMFYTWVVYYLANFLAFLLCGLFFFRLGFNNYLYGMKETVDSELRIDGFNDISKLDDVYNWLDGTLVNVSIPNLPYALVGPVVLQQERAHYKTKKISLVGRMDNLTKFEKPVFFYDSYLIPRNFSSFEPWGTGPNDKKPFGNSGVLNTNTKSTRFTTFLNPEPWSQIQRLKETGYIDEWTSQVRVQLVFHSKNIDGFCLVRIDFDRYPSNYLRKKIEYQAFSMENAENDFVIYSQYSSVSYYLWYFFNWYFAFFIVSETVTLLSIYDMKFVRDNVLFQTYVDWCNSQAMIKHNMIKRERKRWLENHEHNILFTIFYFLLNATSNVGAFVVLLKRLLWTLIVHMNFGKLFYVAVHLSIVWTYVKYYEQRELFFDAYRRANGDTLEYLVDDVKLLATNEYLTILRDIKDTLMDLRAIYVYWGIVTIINIHKQLYMHPQAGQFFLGIYHTFTSFQVILFLAILVTEYSLLTCFYIVMYGDIKKEFSTPLNSFVNTLFFSLLGEVEIDTILPLDSSEAPLFLQFLFLIVVLFPTIMMLTNLFIAIIVAIWDKQNKKKLWNDFLDEKLRSHLKCEFANEFYASNYFVRLMLWTDRVFSNHHLKCGKGGRVIGYTQDRNSYILCCCMKTRIKGTEEWAWETLHDDEDTAIR